MINLSPDTLLENPTDYEAHAAAWKADRDLLDVTRRLLESLMSQVTTLQVMLTETEEDTLYERE